MSTEIDEGKSLNRGIGFNACSGSWLKSHSLKNPHGLSGSVACDFTFMVGLYQTTYAFA